MPMTNSEYQKRYRLKHPEKVNAHGVAYRKNNPEWALHNSAKHRAKKVGRDFDIEVSDVVIPNVCPILNIPLFKGSGKVSDNSPSLDRIDQEKGYVKGNVAVISYRANRLKGDLTMSQLTNLISYMQKKD